MSPFVYGPGGKAEAPDAPTQSGPTQYHHGTPDAPLPSLPDPDPPADPADQGGTSTAPVTWGYTEPPPDPDAGGYGYQPHIDLGVGPYHLDPITPPQMPDDSGADAQSDPYGDGGYGQTDPYAGGDGYDQQGDPYADAGGYDPGDTGQA